LRSADLVHIFSQRANIASSHEVINRFARGEHGVRVSGRRRKEIAKLGESFNLMADTIVANIERFKGDRYIAQRARS